MGDATHRPYTLSPATALALSFPAALCLMYFPLTLALIIAIASWRLIHTRRYVHLALFAAGLAYALIRGFGPPAGLPSDKVALGGYFTGEAESGGMRFRQEFRVTSRGEGADKVPSTLTVFTDTPYPVGIAYGTIMGVSAHEPHINPGMRGQAGVTGTLYEITAYGGPATGPLAWASRARWPLTERIRAAYPPETAALVTAVTTGARGGFTPETEAAFRSTGLAHLLSISGTHFGFFAVLMFGLVRLAVTRLPRRALERLTERVTPDEFAAYASAPFLVFYYALSGAEAPATRSFLMVMLFLVGLLIARRGQWFGFLSAAACVILIIAPPALLTASFQLSFTAVLFIGLLVEHTDNAGRIETRKGLSRTLVTGPMLISLAATAGTAPIVAHYFHSASLISPLANLIVTPLVCMALIPLSLMSALADVITRTYMGGALVSYVADAVLRLVRSLASIPHASVYAPAVPGVLVAAYYASFVPFLVTRKRLWLLMLLAPMAATAALYMLQPARPLNVTFLDAGHADSSVIASPDGTVVVIDTGRSGAELSAYLRSRGVARIDALALTHPHADHAGGAGRIAREFEVRTLWLSPMAEVAPESPLANIPARTLSRGDVINAPGFTVLVLHPPEDFYSTSDSSNTRVNDASLTLRLEGNGHSVYFAGDLEEEGTDDLRAVPVRWQKSDVLKAPHHGLRPDANRDLATLVAPSLVVVTAGGGRTEGARAMGERLLHTGEDGAVRLTLATGAIRVDRYADYVLHRTLWPRGEWDNYKRLFKVW